MQVLTAAKMDCLKTVMTALKNNQLDKKDWISWSAYHASIQEAIIPPTAINAYCHFSWKVHTQWQ